MSEDRIVVGALSGAFGVRGEVRLKSYCAQPEAIAAYVPLTTAQGDVFTRVTITGQTSNALVARLDGVETREQADRLRGRELLAERARLPAPDDDEFYHADLIGLAVHDTGGGLLGTVRAVQNHGADDLLEVQPSGGGATFLLPFTRAVVPTVDLAARRIVADPPDGLF